jgi:hypothetical protein
MNDQRKSKSERIFLYVPHAWFEKALELGWENPLNLGPPHNNYSILMEWRKDGEPIMPFRCREKKNVRR